MSTNPFERGWGKPPAARTVRVPCAGLPLNLDPRVAPLFAELIARVERIRGKGWMLSSGGNNFRPVRGYEQKYRTLSSSNPAAAMDLLSNHSWALAADFRAATNPQMRNGPTDMPGNMEQLCRDLGLVWGGTFSGARRDPMHVEVAGTPEDARRAVERLNVKNILEAAVAELSRGELDRIMEAVDNYNRTWNAKQVSRVDNKTPLYLADGLMYAEANLSRIAGFLEQIAKKGGLS